MLFDGGASFDPASWLLVDPLRREEVADLLALTDDAYQLDKSNSEIATAISQLRVRRHERFHYFQYACTPFGMLLSRLHLIRLACARVVMEHESEQIGRITPLHRLTAMSLADVPERDQMATELDGVSQFRIMRPQWMNDHSWFALLRWNAAVDAEKMLLGWNMPPAYAVMTWDILFRSAPNICLLDDQGESYIAPSLSDVPENGTAPIGTTTGEELLEGSARVAEFRGIHPSFVLDATRRLAQGGQSFYWLTLAKAAEALHLAPQDPVVVVLHDLAMHQFPDPEALAAPPGELSWRACHPGHFFDAALSRLSQRVVPAHLSTTDAYDFLIAALDMPADCPYRRYQTWSRTLPGVDDLLHARNELTMGDVQARMVAASNPLTRFQVATLRAASRLRSEDVTIFTRDLQHVSEWAIERCHQILTPPVVLSTTTVDTFSPVSGDPAGHFWILRELVVRLILNELASCGRLAKCLDVARILSRQYGREYVETLILHALVGIGESLTTHVRGHLEGALR